MSDAATRRNRVRIYDLREAVSRNSGLTRKRMGSAKGLVLLKDI